MARPSRTRNPVTEPPSPALAADDFLIFVREDDEDRRALRWAIGAAALAHLALFLLTFPQLAAEIEEPEPRRAWVMPAVRFRPPPPASRRLLPEPRALKVPVPDPTPELPEPLRLAEELEAPSIVTPDLGSIPFPDSPPPLPAEPIRICCGSIDPPVAIHTPQPRYTEIARRAGIEGYVIVEAVIDAGGAVTRVKVLKGLSFGLDEATVATLGDWRFEPALLDGRPVPVLYTLTVNFRLR